MGTMFILGLQRYVLILILQYFIESFMLDFRHNGVFFAIIL